MCVQIAHNNQFEQLKKAKANGIIKNKTLYERIDSTCNKVVEFTRGSLVAWACEQLQV